MKLAGLMIGACLLVCVMPMSVMAEDDFSVIWVVNMPREIYFIGETMTVEIYAYASTDPTLFVPGEMALVTIRNESLQESYSSWFTTNTNGTILVQWDIPLEMDTGNYTFVLAPIMAENIVIPFLVLYDENTYWQKRVENLEDELKLQYEYLNYLYSSNNYLNKQVKILKDQVFIAGIIMFVTLMATMWVVIPEWARRANQSEKRENMSSKLAKLMGFSSTPKVLLTEHHEELAQLKTPENKKPPRYGMIHHCSICDPEGKELLTRKAYIEHLEFHTRHVVSLAKWRRERIFKALISDHYKLPVDDLAVEKTVRLDKKKSDLVDSVELAKKELKAMIHEDSRTQKQRDRLRKQYDKKAKKKRAKEEKQLAKQAKKSIEKVEPVLKQTTSRKPQVARKLRTEKPISGIPEAVPAKKHAVDAQRTPIDDLFEKLSSEKVN